MLKITELENGLTIITEHIPDLRSATVSFMVKVGSGVETIKNNGISHFVEHLLFKGTETRSAQEIAQAIEDYGGNLNAFTEKEMTYYYAKVLSEQVNTAVDIFSDMVLNSRFDADEIELERQVILEEIKMGDDSPDEVVYENLFKGIWGENALGLPITGSYNSIQNLERSEIIDYVNSYYAPDNVIISISGNFDYESVLDIIKKRFEPFDRSSRTVHIEIPAMTPGLYLKEKDIEQAHVCLGTKGISILDDSRFALATIDLALAGGLSSRLFQEVREKRGLAYSINSYKALYKAAGIYGVYAGTSIPNIQQVLDIVLGEFAQIRENGLSEEELVRSKKQLKGSLLLGLESTYYRSYRNAHSYVYYDRILSVDDICKIIDNITVNQVKEVAQILFDPDNYSLSIVGPRDMPGQYVY